MSTILLITENYASDDASTLDFVAELASRGHQVTPLEVRDIPAGFECTDDLVILDAQGPIAHLDLLNLAKPVMVTNGNAPRASMGMATSNAAITNGGLLEFDLPDHPLAAGLSEQVSIGGNLRGLKADQVAPGAAAVISRSNNAYFYVIGFEAGSDLVDGGTFPTRRVYHFAAQAVKPLVSEAGGLLEAAIAWLITTPPSPVDDPFIDELETTIAGTAGIKPNTGTATRNFVTAIGAPNIHQAVWLLMRAVAKTEAHMNAALPKSERTDYYHIHISFAHQTYGNQDLLMGRLEIPTDVWEKN
ncbi:MAG: hypothetical protein AAGH78_17405 [Cyanobacteria bacterium P01_H01_bin.58]